MSSLARWVCSGATGIGFFCLAFFAVLDEGPLWAVSFAALMGLIGAATTLVVIAVFAELGS